MSSIVPIKCKCSVCGETNEYRSLASTNSFGGGPDLDLRPAEMARSTIDVWIQECPKCGYISGKVSDPSGVNTEWLKSDKYLSCDGILFLSKLAVQFYKYYLINLEDNNTEGAFYAILHAAWACDDKEDIINAKHCRELAIELATILIDEEHEDEDNIRLVRADMMRRTGQFDEMIRMYETVEFGEELMNQILEFEIEKSKDKDSLCYRVEDVLGEKL